MTREHDLCLHVQDAASRNAWICRPHKRKLVTPAVCGSKIGAVSPQLDVSRTDAQVLHSESSRCTRSASCRLWWYNPMF